MASKSSISVIEKNKNYRESNVSSSEQLIEMRSSTQQSASNTRAEIAVMLFAQGSLPDWLRVTTASLRCFSESLWSPL